MSYESGLNYRTITVEKYDALLAVAEAAEAQHDKWDGYCAKYGRNCPTCIALDALDVAPMRTLPRSDEVFALTEIRRIVG